MQTLVFSATMSKDLQRNLKRYKGSKPRSAAENTIGGQDNHSWSNNNFDSGTTGRVSTFSSRLSRLGACSNRSQSEGPPGANVPGEQGGMFVNR